MCPFHATSPLYQCIKYVRDHLASYMQVNKTHDHHTRGSRDLKIDYTMLYNDPLFYEYNKLPSAIKETASKTQFLAKTKEYLKITVCYNINEFLQLVFFFFFLSH